MFKFGKHSTGSEDDPKTQSAQDEQKQDVPVPKSWEEYEPVNPFVLLGVLFAITFLPMMALSYIQWFTSEYGQGEDAAVEQTENSIYRANVPIEVGTYPLTYIFDTTSNGKRSWHISYTGEEDHDEHFVVDDENVSFEAGNAFEVTVYLTTIDRMSSESEDAEVLEANALPADLHFTVHYDANRREIQTYQFISLAKNGNSPATLTFSEAPGVTDTIEVPTSAIKVINDGLGYVEKISEYDEHAQWITHWIIHSLPV